MPKPSCLGPVLKDVTFILISTASRWRFKLEIFHLKAELELHFEYREQNSVITNLDDSLWIPPERLSLEVRDMIWFLSESGCRAIDLHFINNEYAQTLKATLDT